MIHNDRMTEFDKTDNLPRLPEMGQHKGYTLIEILGVTAIIIIVVFMTQGMIRNYKRYSIEETAVQRLKELARLENVYRSCNDPTVNADGTFGTFFELQNAGLIAEFYKEDDDYRRTLNAFVPFYRLDFMSSIEDINDIGMGSQDEVDMDRFRLLIRAIPVYNYPLGLRTFYMNEEGEVYFEDMRFKETGQVTTR